MSIKGTVVKGWRSRLEQERQAARAAVDSLRTGVEMVEDRTFNRSEPLKGGRIGHRVRFERDHTEESSKVKELRLEARRIAWADNRDKHSEEKRRYWASLSPVKKAEVIQRMTDYNRTYRAQNRELVNEWARSYNARNRDVVIVRKRVARAAMSEDQKSHQRLVAAIYQQLLRLAGLAPWQQKNGGIGGVAPDAKQKVQASIPMVRGHKSKHANTPAARLESIFSAFQAT